MCVGRINAKLTEPLCGLADSARPPLQNLEESLRFADESLAKSVDDLMLFRRLDDLAEVDKVRYTGPPPRVIKNPTGQGAGNPVVLKTQVASGK